MNGEDACALFEPQLSDYKKEEIKKFELVYYFNPATKKDSEDLQETKYNDGFDKEDGHYLFEMGDDINYRYEILLKLGQGTFGVVLSCRDHKK